MQDKSVKRLRQRKFVAKRSLQALVALSAVLNNSVGPYWSVDSWCYEWETVEKLQFQFLSPAYRII